MKVECDICGRRFSRTASEVRKWKRHFCCRKCFHKYRRDNMKKKDKYDMRHQNGLNQKEKGVGEIYEKVVSNKDI